MTPITVLVSVDSNSILLGAKEFVTYMRNLVANYNMDSLVTVLETVYSWLLQRSHSPSTTR